jgi:hypothetical protein
MGFGETLAPLLKSAASDSECDGLAARMVMECKQGALPLSVVDEGVQIKAVRALLAPRQVLGSVNWTTFLKLIVRKLPGGRHFLSLKGFGSWQPFNDIYARSLVHESDVVVYMLLLVITLDNKLVQQFIGSNHHFNTFLEIQKAVTMLISKDKETIANLEDDLTSSELLDKDLAVALERFNSKLGNKHTSKDEEAMDNSMEREPEKETSTSDDAVMRNMLLNL